MWFFKRKKKQEDTPPVLPTFEHEHTWKDMPWYMETEYDGPAQWARYKIIEPYICITCGERKNICLEKTTYNNIDPKTREEYYNTIRKRYRRYLKPQAVVEDMINNILLVKDPDYLETVEIMRGIPHRGCGTSSQMPPINRKASDIGELVVPKKEDNT